MSRNGAHMHRESSYTEEARTGEVPSAVLAVPSNLLAGAFLGSLIGAVGVILAQAAPTDLIATGAAVLGALGVVHGIGVGNPTSTNSRPRRP